MKYIVTIRFLAKKGGSDKYDNLVLVMPYVHEFIHAKESEAIQKYMQMRKWTALELRKINKYRESAGLPRI